MKITQEIAAVFADQERRELSIIMGGVRITLGQEEARALSAALTSGLRQLGVEAPAARPAPPPVAAPASSAEEDDKNVADFRALLEGAKKIDPAEAVRRANG